MIDCKAKLHLQYVNIDLNSYIYLLDLFFKQSWIGEGHRLLPRFSSGMVYGYCMIKWSDLILYIVIVMEFNR